MLLSFRGLGFRVRELGFCEAVLFLCRVREGYDEEKFISCTIFFDRLSDFKNKAHPPDLMLIASLTLVHNCFP